MHTTTAALLALVPLLGPATLQDSAPAAPAQDHEWTQEELERVSAEIQLEIEKLRGQKFARQVAVKLASIEDLMAYVAEREAKTETPEEFAADETIAKMLGVVPNHVDLRKAMHDLLA